MDFSSALPVSHMHFQGEVIEDQQQVYQYHRNRKPQLQERELQKKKKKKGVSKNCQIQNLFIYLLQ